MLSRKTDHSSYKAFLNRPFDRLLAILLSYFAQWIYPGRSCPNRRTVSIQIVSQIPQANFGLHPDQTNGPDDQVSCPLRLDPKDVFHTTPNSGTRSVPLSLSIRQCLVPASLALKMLPILSLLQLSEFLLRTVRRVHPHIPTAAFMGEMGGPDDRALRCGRAFISAFEKMYFFVTAIKREAQGTRRNRLL